MKLSLHVSGDGAIPLLHQVLNGAEHQAPHAKDLLQRLQARLQRQDIIICSDRAGVSYDIIAAYREAKAHFVSPLQETDVEREALAVVPLAEFQELDYRSRSAPDERFLGYSTTLVIRRQKRRKPMTVDALFVYSTQKRRTDAQTREQRLQGVERRLREIGGYLNKNRYTKEPYAREQLAKAVAKARGMIGYQLTVTDGTMALRFRRDEAAIARLQYDAYGRRDGRAHAQT